MFERRKCGSDHQFLLRLLQYSWGQRGKMKSLVGKRKKETTIHKLRLSCGEKSQKSLECSGFCRDHRLTDALFLSGQNLEPITRKRAPCRQLFVRLISSAAFCCHIIIPGCLHVRAETSQKPRRSVVYAPQVTASDLPKPRLSHEPLMSPTDAETLDAKSCNRLISSKTKPLLSSLCVL